MKNHRDLLLGVLHHLLWFKLNELIANCSLITDLFTLIDL